MQLVTGPCNLLDTLLLLPGRLTQMSLEGTGCRGIRRNPCRLTFLTFPKQMEAGLLYEAIEIF